MSLGHDVIINDRPRKRAIELVNAAAELLSGRGPEQTSLVRTCIVRPEGNSHIKWIAGRSIAFKCIGSLEFRLLFWQRLKMRPSIKIYINRLAVVLLFLFALADILAPELCSEDLGGLALAADRRSLDADSVAPDDLRSDDRGIFAASGKSRNEESSKSGQFSDDCYCCCSHVLPSLFFIPALVVSKPSVTQPHSDCVPTPHLAKPYHPPRAA